MAEVNILQGTIKGKLGKVTGQVWKGKPVIKAGIFSKAPPTNAQTQSVRAFEALNRIASTISRLGFQYLGLTAKNIHNHNAVAKWLKPAVRGNAFTPANIQEIIPLSNNVFISRFIQNLSAGTLSVVLSLRQGFVPEKNTQLFVIVFDDTGRVHWSDIRACDNFSTVINIDTSMMLVYSVMAFLSIPNKKTFVQDNFLYRRGAGMQYSLEEQLTGDLWIDESPIYQKTFSITVPQLATGVNARVDIALPEHILLIKSSLISLPSQDRLLSYEGFPSDLNTTSGAFAFLKSVAYFNSSTGTLTVMFNPENATIATRNSNTTNFLTIQYIKTG